MKQEIDFHGLARPAQDRFVDGVKGTYELRPLLAAKGGPKTAFVWVGLSVIAAVLLFLLQRQGYGELGSAMSVQGTPLLAAYVVLGCAIVLGVVQAASGWSRTAALPFPAGVYLFPTCVIDARRHRLVVHKLSELSSVQGPDASNVLTLVFADGSFALRAEDRDALQRATDAIAAARDEAPPPSSRLVDIDPLKEPKFVSPLAPQDPIVLHAPIWITLRFGLAVVLGAAIGPGVWWARNVSSDDRTFAKASEQGDIDGFHAYLAHGKRHRQEVATMLLPRAELKVAQRAGTVEAIEKYIQDHPGSAIAREVDAALRKAMLDELERAKKPGTLESLRAFAQKHPDHHLKAELEEATHAVYLAAIAKYKGEAAKDKDAIALMERLVAWAEAKGPAVTVRFKRKASNTLPRADKAVAKNPAFHGEISYPTKYFDPAHVSPKETVLGKTLVDRFSAAFPAEILSFSQGALVDDPNDALPKVEAPTLLVSYVVEWVGVAYVSKQPHGIFCGLTFVFDVAFLIPGDAKPYRLKHGIARPVPLDVLGDKSAPASTPVEERVYQAMAQEAFTQLGGKLLGAFFAK